MSAQPLSTVEGYVDIGGGRIHYLDQGEGTPVLLVHGAFGSGSTFLQNTFAASLARGHRLIAPDSLAHGGSSSPTEQER